MTFYESLGWNASEEYPATRDIHAWSRDRFVPANTTRVYWRVQEKLSKAQYDSGSVLNVYEKSKKLIIIKYEQTK